MGRNHKLRLKKEDQICNGIDTAKLKCHLGQLQIPVQSMFNHQAAISISTEHVQVLVLQMNWENITVHNIT